MSIITLCGIATTVYGCATYLAPYAALYAAPNLLDKVFPRRRDPYIAAAARTAVRTRYNLLVDSTPHAAQYFLRIVLPRNSWLSCFILHRYFEGIFMVKTSLDALALVSGLVQVSALLTQTRVIVWRLAPVASLIGQKIQTIMNSIGEEEATFQAAPW